MTSRPPVPSVRAAVPEDAEAIARIKVEGWRFAYRGLLPEELLAGLDVGTTASDWRGLIERTAGTQAGPRVAFLHPSSVVGFLQAARGEGGGGRVNALYLDPAHMGTGAGHALMGDALERLAAAGCSWAELWVLEGNQRAIGFYQRHGWKPTGETREEHMGQTILHELRMRIRLDG